MTIIPDHRMSSSIVGSGIRVLALLASLHAIEAAELLDLTDGKLPKDQVAQIHQLSERYFSALQARRFDEALAQVTPRQRDYLKGLLPRFTPKIEPGYEIALMLQDGQPHISIANSVFGSQVELLDGRWYVFSKDIDDKYHLTKP